MVPVAILSFLVGAVFAWGFRVWILFPLTLLAVIAATCVELSHDGGIMSAIGHVLLIGMLPQLGYGFSLVTMHTLLMLRVPSASRSLGTSIATLFKQRTSD